MRRRSISRRCCGPAAASPAAISCCGRSPNACAHARLGIIAGRKVARARGRPQSRASGSSAKPSGRPAAGLGRTTSTVQLRGDSAARVERRACATELRHVAGSSSRALADRPAIAARQAVDDGITTPHTVLRLLVFAVHAVRRMAARPATRAPAPTRRRRRRARTAPRTRRSAARARSSCRHAAARRHRRPAARLRAGRAIKVETDVFHAEISTMGGDLRRLELKQHRDVEDKKKNFVLFQQRPDHTYVAQSGLLGGEPADAPHAVHRRRDAIQAGRRRQTRSRCACDAPPVERRQGDEGLSLPARELSDRRRRSRSRTRAPRRCSRTRYFQFLRDDKPPAGDSAMLPTFTGVGVYTEKEKFQKIAFADIEKNKATLPEDERATAGSRSSSTISSARGCRRTARRASSTRARSTNLYAAGVIVPAAAVAAGRSGDGQRAAVRRAAGAGQARGARARARSRRRLRLAHDHRRAAVLAAPVASPVGRQLGRRDHPPHGDHQAHCSIRCRRRATARWRRCA